VKRLPILAKVFLFLVCFSFVLSAYNSGSVVNNNLIIPFVEYAPDIDGEMDEEWTFSPVGMFVYEVAGGAGAAASQKLNHSAWFKAAYNDDGFYFFATVVDDIIYMDSTAYDYEQDCFEIYFDGDNSKGATYDGVDDVQWRWVYGATGAGTPGGGQPECPNAEGMWVETASGYQFELKIPAEDLTFTPAEGAVIGFEVQCADNDTGARDAIGKWWNINGSSWQQPQLFGTVELVSESTAPAEDTAHAGISEPATAGVDLSVPAIIASGSAVVSLSVPGTVSLYNIAGQEVKSVNAAGSVVTIDVSDLANGVYLVNLRKGNASATKKVTLLK